MASSPFFHHVFFWLHRPEDRPALVAGLQALSRVSTIRTFHIGKPAATSRDVIDNSYSVSWLVEFDHGADQDRYQSDPIHLEFVRTCSHLWKKVLVYDSEDLV